MKYIRTKDGKIWSFSNPSNNFLYEGSSTKNGKWLHEIGEVFKEADTIEELCDCFVDYCEEDDSHLVSTEKPIRRRNHEIYGAIWTEHGLIFVAKMNKKGKLELLDKSCSMTGSRGD